VAYTLLNGIRVLEVAWLAGDVAGQQLAELGAEVIKIEKPGDGDYSRTVGPVSLVTDDGLSIHHLHWNRGKKSIELDLKTPQGRDVFLKLVEKSDVVIEGLRAGALGRWGLGYEALRELKPSIVFCSLSGMGASGPYTHLPTHGFSYDAFTGLAPPAHWPDGNPRVPGEEGALLDYNLGGVYAALGIVAAIVNALRTGEGAFIEVAQTEALAHIRSEKVDRIINRDRIKRRKSYGSGEGFATSTRSNYYSTKDDKVIFIQAIERKFWDSFCRAAGRPDLPDKYPSDIDYDHQPGLEDLRKELQEIFRTRTLDEWVQVFVDENIPGGPVYTLDELIHDRHYKARPNYEDVDIPGVGTVTLTTSPIRVGGQTFGPSPAPAVGQHNDEIAALANGSSSSG
jgi:crotonobetainyl-CoA:carnitine CoA-transferase CaiB-like acyl-CoA transferase